MQRSSVGQSAAQCTSRGSVSKNRDLDNRPMQRMQGELEGPVVMSDAMRMTSGEAEGPKLDSIISDAVRMMWLQGRRLGAVGLHTSCRVAQKVQSPRV